MKRSTHTTPWGAPNDRPNKDLLEGGRTTSVWKVGNFVHRTTGPWTRTVHAFLRHLEAAHFDGAPRVVGFDDEGREVLTFIDGEVLSNANWTPGDPGRWPSFAQTDEALVAAAALLRRLHESAASFQPSKPRWKEYAWPDLLESEIVCHGDVGRHNTVYRGGLPVAFIDWDEIRPGAPIVEFGAAAWDFVPIADYEYLASAELEKLDIPSRLRLFAETYGQSDPDRVIWALQESAQRLAERLRYWDTSPAESAKLYRLAARRLDWLDEHAAYLMSRFE